MEIVDRQNYVDIYPFDGDSFYRVQAYKATANYLGEKGKFDPARVSWPSIGARTPKEAREFANAILKAADLAEQSNEVESAKASPNRKEPK